MPTKAQLEKRYREADKQLYLLKGEYSDCTTLSGRAIYALRVIAGLVAHDDGAGSTPRLYAYNWLKKHGKVANQKRFLFDDEEETTQ